MTPTDNPIRSILFVCMGNICRSPAGENFMRKALEDADLDSAVSCDSAGTIGYHTGASPDSRMSSAARRRGMTLVGKARRIEPNDLVDFDLVVAMDNANYADIVALADETNRHKVVKFCDYCEEHEDKEVPDPYYGGEQGFEHVLDLMEDGCAQILKHVERSHQA